MARRAAKVGDLTRLMDKWAPPWAAEPWDSVGLAVGDPRSPVQTAWTALELCPELLRQARQKKVDLLLIHHPPMFKPLKDLCTNNPKTKRLVEAAGSGLAVFAAHTNLDSAPGGVNDALAQALGITGVKPLAPAPLEGLAKLVAFAPPEYVEPVSKALFEAGAGRIGQYTECAFYSAGTGAYKAPAEASPFAGAPGERHTLEEVRLEVIIDLSDTAKALRSLFEAHPYEEPAYDIYPLRQAPSGFGPGRIGGLESPCAGSAFLADCAKVLGSAAPAVSGPDVQNLERVAVVGGSGGDYLGLAAAQGAQMLITGEASHHAAEEAQDLGVALAVLGHYETESVIVEPWARRLSSLVAKAGLECNIEPWTSGPIPWRPVGI